MIPTHNWSSQIVMSHVVGQLLEKIGCTVEYTSTDSQAVYEAVRIGDATIELEVWEGSFATSFNTALDKGGILDAGTHDAVTREEWWYPTYVEELCPGLPDWEALAACAEMFARPDSGGKGVYVDGPVEWLHDPARIGALGMNFLQINVGGAARSGPSLRRRRSRTSRSSCSTGRRTSPTHCTAARSSSSGVRREVQDRRKLGTNPDATNDCGSPAGGYLKKAAWHGMPTKWPAAYKALTRINFTTNHVGTMAMFVDVEEMEHDEAAMKWIAENEDVWNAWLYASQ